MYLTHYGCVGDVPQMAAALFDVMQRMVDIALALRDAPDRHARLREGLLDLYLRLLRERGCEHSDETITALLTMDVELNVQGLGVWLDRQ